MSILKIRVTQILVEQDRYHPGYQLEHNGYRFDKEDESIKQAGVADGAVITIYQGVDPDASQTASDAEEHEDAESQGGVRQDKHTHSGHRQREKAEQSGEGAWPHNVPTKGTDERWTFMMVYEDGAIDMSFDQGTEGLHILRTAAEAKQVRDWRRVSVRHARSSQCIHENTNLEDFGAQQKDVFNVEIMDEESWEGLGTESSRKAPPRTQPASRKHRASMAGDTYPKGGTNPRGRIQGEATHPPRRPAQARRLLADRRATA